MEQHEKNRFEDFFADRKYLSLKNNLYNYVLRKRAIEKEFGDADKGVVLEVGCGISPTVTSLDAVVYSDLSFAALHTLDKMLNKGFYVVADGTCLPFKSKSFSHVVCSEVMEHIENDKKAVIEIARILEPAGSFVITFPHRKMYFSIDDYYVGHYRRYELNDMINLLNNAGLTPISIKKVLGPLEKVTMVALFLFIKLFKIHAKSKAVYNKNKKISRFLSLFFKWLNQFYAVLAWIDARIMPLNVSTVLLIKAIKKDN